MNIVKCYYCDQKFDKNREEWFKPINNRYAHKACASNPHIQKAMQEQNVIDHFYQYVKKILGDEFNFIRVRKQVEEYLKEPYKYTYQGMELTLKYWYEIEQNNIDKANGAIGIIPFVYNDAKKYFMDIYKAKEINKNKNLTMMNQTKAIKIQAPQRIEKCKKLFEL